MHKHAVYKGYAERVREENGGGGGMRWGEAVGEGGLVVGRMQLSRIKVMQTWAVGTGDSMWTH